MSLKDRTQMYEVIQCYIELESYEQYETLNRLEMREWYNEEEDGNYFGASSIELSDIGTLYFTAESFEHAHAILEKIEAYLGGTHDQS